MKKNTFISKFDDQPGKLNQIAKKIGIEFFAEREYIIREGTIGNEFYIILSGQVEILKSKKVGGLQTDETMGVINSNGSFGELALFDDKPR